MQDQAGANAPTDAVTSMEAGDAIKRQRLQKMKWIANGLLAAAAVLFIVATALRNAHPAMPYVAAFAEAAMIGAIADWFAVVALFRHPLGLRFIPHTAIIPANKARIAANLGDFVQGEFFSTQRILSVVEALRPAEKAAQWLSQPQNARELADLATRGLPYLLGQIDTPQARDYVRGRVAEQAEKADLAGWIAAMLEIAVSGQRHQAVLDQVVEAISTMLERPHVREQVQQMLAEALPLYFETLKLVGGKIAAERIVHSLRKLFDDIIADPNHELRHRFTNALTVFIDRLRHDPTYREGIAAYVGDTLRSPAFAARVDGLVIDVITWVRGDLRQPQSRIHAIVTAAILKLGATMASDADMRRWIDERIMQAAPPVIARYRPRISAFISHKMLEWKDEEIVDKMELNIGRDLQFIRLNGTVVGGLAGLLIFSVGALFGE